MLAPAPGDKIYETATIMIWAGEDQIVRVVTKPSSVHRSEDAEQNTTVMPEEERVGRPVLVDIRQIRSVTREARQIYRDPQRNLAPAMALLVASPVSRVIGNFFIGISQMPHPVRLFNAAAEALAWLEQYTPHSRRRPGASP